MLAALSVRGRSTTAKAWGLAQATQSSVPGRAREPEQALPSSAPGQVREQVLAPERAREPEQALPSSGREPEQEPEQVQLALAQVRPGPV